MSEATILTILEREYFRLLREETIGKTPDTTKKLDELEKAIKKYKEDNEPRK